MTQPLNWDLFQRRASLDQPEPEPEAAPPVPPEDKDFWGQVQEFFTPREPSPPAPAPPPASAPEEEDFFQHVSREVDGMIERTTVALQEFFEPPAPAPPPAEAPPPPEPDKPLDRVSKFFGLPPDQPQAGRRSSPRCLARGKSRSSAGGSPSASIPSLLAEHADAIDALRDVLRDEPLFQPKRHDGLWLLRFCLSHEGNPKRAAEAARFTLRWRAEHKLDQVADFVRTHPQAEWPSAAKIAPVFPMRLYQPDAERGPFLLMIATDVDPEALPKAGISKADDFAYALHMTEWMHQSVDAATRRTGRLTKVCRLIDVKAAEGKHLQAVFFGPVGGAASSQAIEDAYPQLVGALFVFNLPGAGRWMWDHTVKPLLPPRVACKSFVVDPGSAADRDNVATYIAPEHLPTRYGGKSEAWPPPDATVSTKRR